MSANKPISLVMVGCGGVGKSSLTLRFVFDEFEEAYDPTRADSYRKTLEIDGNAHEIDILDTAGQEQYAAIRDNYYRSGEGFICVFSLNDPGSLRAISDFHKQICRSHGEEVEGEQRDVQRDGSLADTTQPPHTTRPRHPIILVGNKADLLPRSITFSEAQRFTSTVLGPSAKYLETSAKTGQGVEETFKVAVEMVLEFRRASEVQRAAEAKLSRLQRRRRRRRCSIQ